MNELPELSVSDFVALLNQTLEFAYPSITVSGELANFRISKNRWVYFDLKDELSTVRCFGTVYQLPGPLEDGMLLRVRAQPRLHPQYGFSLNIQAIQPTGEGSIKRAAQLLQAKLTAEGLFAPERKRPLPYPPARIGLITSKESAAYADFIKIMATRWGGVDIELIDTQVQGEVAPAQLVAAIDQFNAMARPPEVLVLVRGGGSAEDLAAYSTEMVTRAVAASRVPTLVAIGHETDLSLAELAADQRASTPSNAAELLVPDRGHQIRQLRDTSQQLQQLVSSRLRLAVSGIQDGSRELEAAMRLTLERAGQHLDSQNRLLAALNPEAILRRGYAVVHDAGGRLVRSVQQVTAGAIVDVRVSDGQIITTVNQVKKATH